MVIAKDVSNVTYNVSFEKPLNPILGETFQARGRDGADILMEQIAHHPPTTAFMVQQQNYTVNGTMEWAIRSGPLTAEVTY